jgi:hypothetical protein
LSHGEAHGPGRWKGQPDGSSTRSTQLQSLRGITNPVNAGSQTIETMKNRILLPADFSPLR